MTLVTIGEAIAWVCTREADKLAEISQVSRGDRLREAFFKYQGGTRLEKRVRLDSMPSVGGGQHASAQQALIGLQQALLGGIMPVMAFGSSSHGARLLSAGDLIRLELRACGDERASCGFWSAKAGEFLWWEPMVFMEDLERLWPAPRVPPTVRTTQRILEFLLGETIEGPMKKDIAKNRARQAVADFGDRRFAEAWKRLPAERKVGRGKRGPNRKPVV